MMTRQKGRLGKQQRQMAGKAGDSFAQSSLQVPLHNNHDGDDYHDHGNHDHYHDHDDYHDHGNHNHYHNHYHDDDESGFTGDVSVVGGSRAT